MVAIKGAPLPRVPSHMDLLRITCMCRAQVSTHCMMEQAYVSREEEWQFPSQIMPVVRDTVAHAGFKITKVATET